MNSEHSSTEGKPVQEALLPPVKSGGATGVEQRYSSAFRNPAIAFGTNFAAAMAICAYGGYRLDRHLGTGETFILSGVALALLYGGYELWKIVRLQNTEPPPQKSPPNTPPLC